MAGNGREALQRARLARCSTEARDERKAVAERLWPPREAKHSRRSPRLLGHAVVLIEGPPDLLERAVALRESEPEELELRSR